MKIKIFGLKKEDKKEIENLAKKYNLQITAKNPEVCICIKGDGTILYAEQKFPSIPKLTIRNKNHIGAKCIYDIDWIDELFSKLSQKKYAVKKYSKIQCIFKNRKINALNEVQIHNIITIKALRFSLKAMENKKIVLEEKNIIGDGCIFSTPFGSTAYFTSVGGEKFEKGFGIALNNPFNRERKSFYLNENAVFECVLNRGSAYLLTDNNPKALLITKGEKIVLKKSDEYFQEVHVDE
ncbi:MAG: hypothetical protein DRN66_00435 [Candidatus Nanohalarchaeota archaeon]|nr:MAG: hypothetical protein DRN66_00435 [Candidatus Nanohaloarchaeota archaeon]